MTSGQTITIDDVEETKVLVNPDSVYEFYLNEILPAITSSFPILLHRLWNDIISFVVLIVHKLYMFIQPTYYNSNNSPLVGDNSSYNANENGWVWFSREWPLMDLKIGVFLWQTFGGLLFVIAVLSIMPGRLHTMTGKILRWPILIVIYLLINVELIVYIVIRIAIRIIETLVATPKHRALRSKINNSVSYKEWYKSAAALDASQKRDRWQKSINDSTSYQYNWPLIQQLVKDMRDARSRKDPINALAILQQCTRKNVGGIMNEDLFTKTYTGEPKFIVTEFIGEVTKTLYWLTDQTRLSDDVQDEETIILQQQQQQQTEQQTLSYEQNLQQQSIAERDKLCRSLIAFATLSFHNKTESKDGVHTRSTSNIKEKKSQVREKVTTEEYTIPSNSLSPSSTTRGQSSMRNRKGVSGSDHITRVLESTKYSVTGNGNGDDSSNHDETAGFVSSSTVKREQLLKFLKRARTTYGKTALCLSGGSMMGLYHIGHLKGLMETDCLPHIVSGCSAGSVIGAVLCTRTNLELCNDLDPRVIGPHLTCFKRSWPERLASVWKTGNLFSGEDWFKMIKWFTYGDMTFEEAYQKTGRILCIALAATAKKTPPILINYMSAPNVTIASAVVASAAVPGFVSPQQLQTKDPDGTVRSAGPETYFDGSIRHDIPTTGLSEMLNCHFFVACQCNPHIVPFFFNQKGGVGRPSRWSGGEEETSWRGGFLLAALEMYLKNDMRAKFVFLRDLDAAVSFTGTMMTQSFEGSTTIVPQVELRDFFTLFSDPSINRLYHYLQVGSVAAYQHAAMIRCHYRIADALDECIEQLEAERIFEKGRFSESPKKMKVSRRASFEFNKGVVDIQTPTK